MKKFIVSLCMLSYVFIVQAQNFDDYFYNKTLRIQYLHIGDHDSESFEIDSYHSGGKWTGTRSSLIDPNLYGNVLFEAYDSLTNQRIFTRTYSTLFDEYRTTERAEKETGRFEECIMMPLPKRTIRYTFTTISRKLEHNLRYEGYFNPGRDRQTPFKKEYKTMDLHIGGSPEDCLDILFIPDGYAKTDKKLLKNDMERFASYVMECSPFKEHKDKINIRAIVGYSEDSGITDPNRKIYKNTLLNSSYNVLDLDRYLMCLNVWEMYGIADDAPFDAIVIICNSDKYGGGGIYNFYATVNNKHMKSSYVIVHELGHSVGGLGDEYFDSDVSVRDYYPEGIEPMEPNLTTLVAFDKKWKSMVSDETPVPTPAVKRYETTLGVFEGGGYVAEGVYRPMMYCTMKDGIYNAFCPVCSQTLINALYYYSNYKK